MSSTLSSDSAIADLPITELDAEALEAYSNLLQSKGASKSSIYSRQHFLRYTLVKLKGKKKDAKSYGDAILIALKTIANNETLYFFRAVGREFYPFWVNDLKSISLMNATGGFTREPAKIQIDETLVELGKKLDDLPWEERETDLIHSYLKVLKTQGADFRSMRFRQKLLKLLVFKLRGLPMDGIAYRAVVDAILTLLPPKNAQYRTLFLQMAREFYYFWSGDTSAASHVHHQSELNPPQRVENTMS